MNVSYWFIVSGLLILTFLIIIPPLWKKRTVKNESSEQRNVRIAKGKVKELKRQHQAGALTQQQFDDQYEELELSLGDDLDDQQDDKRIQTSESDGRWIIPVLVVLIPLFSMLTYFAIGEPDALKKAEMMQTRQVQTPTQDDINVMVQGLADHLKKEPDNVKGWVMLGRSYKYMKKYDLAVDALANALALAEDDPEIMLDYADALAMKKGGRISGQAAGLVFKSLEKIPNSISGLWLAGMAKAEVGEFILAMQYWKKLETLLPPGSTDLQELKRQMATVQAQILGSAPIKPLVTEERQELAEVSIEVKVSVNSALKEKVSQNDTVFIYAKALTGPPMPLAIVRKQVSDLPLSVTLNDAMAMIPAMKLSNFKAVKVMARISKSGTAIRQKGDYIGTLELKELIGNKSVAIVINKEIQ
ncbi:MAG: c-type cytochrome biogenesis protein CcmI [Methylococcales symbiont of Hymedesmia sp. n. MRB-2018]|nr:MAG: c-type cytochrome biogenesis protein CcmI [Methylococcales symbiont of Hymedesmia sp. n. MRB-2018]KAF3983191.1 MAG: c-type cytochrome biogenesis protein CcmI [Methylococcales symbiont of Hymedesmia sp. n. MRB-2018]